MEVSEIEKKLVKGALYGFLIGLALAILFIPDTITTYTNSTSSVSYDVPMRDYLLQILRFSVIASLVTTVALWIREYYLGPHKKGEPSFFKGFFKGFASFFIGFAIVFLLLLAFTIIT